MSIRAAMLSDARSIAEVHVDAWKSTYRGLVPDAYLDPLNYSDSTERWRRILVPRPGTTFF
jgi:hypothetical protein